MAEIFHFPGTQERLQEIHKATALSWLDELVEMWLKKVPQKINDLLSTPLDRIVILTPEEAKAMIFEFFINNFERKNIQLSLEIIQATQYLSDLLLKFWIVMDEEMKKTLENPYYTYWLEREEPKRAGDASVYNLIFPKTKKNFLTPKEYIHFAVNGYGFYFWKHFASWMLKVLPYAENFTQENPFFRRNFKLVSSKI